MFFENKQAFFQLHNCFHYSHPPPKDDDVLPENKDGHHLEIFAEKKSGESGFTCFEKFSFVGFGLKERRSPPKDGHYLQKKASPMTGPWGGWL